MYMLSAIFSTDIFGQVIHTMELDHFRALADIESGGDDKKIGRNKEISRYQILRPTWKAYCEFPCTPKYYQDPSVAVMVAQKIWGQNMLAFQMKTGRNPNLKEAYAVWNYGFYRWSKNGLAWNLLPKTVQKRAERYENLTVEFYKQTAKKHGIKIIPLADNTTK